MIIIEYNEQLHAHKFDRLDNVLQGEIFELKEQ